MAKPSEVFSAEEYEYVNKAYKDGKLSRQKVEALMSQKIKYESNMKAFMDLPEVPGEKPKTEDTKTTSSPTQEQLKQANPFLNIDDDGNVIADKVTKENYQEAKEADTKRDIAKKTKTLKSDLNDTNFLTRGLNNIADNYSLLAGAGLNKLGVVSDETLNTQRASVAANEQYSDDINKAKRGPIRQKEVEKLEANIQNAEGIANKAKTTAKLLLDKVTHPSEWDPSAVVEMGLDPMNLVAPEAAILAKSAKLGKVANTAIGATAGAVAQGGMAGGFDYGLAKAKGESDEKALEAGLVSGIVGGAVGSVMGGIAGRTATKLKVKTKQEPMSATEVSNKLFDDAINQSKTEPLAQENALDTQKVSDFANEMTEDLKKVHQEIVENDLVVVDKAEKSFQAKKEILDNNPGITPQDKNDYITQNAPLSVEEKAISHILNDGAKVSPRFQGLHAKDALEKSIANPTMSKAELVGTLVDEGVPTEKAKIMGEAYEKQNINIYDEWASEKLSKEIKDGADERVRAREKNERENTSKIKDISEPDNDGTRTSSKQDSKQESLQPIRSGAEKDVLDDGQILSTDSKADEISTKTRELAGYEAIGDDGKVISRPESNKVDTNKEAMDTKTTVKDIEQITTDKEYVKAPMNKKLKMLKEHPKFKEHLENRQNVKAKDAKYDKKRVSDGVLDEEGNYIYPQYDKNWEADFELSKSDVKKIKAGKADETVIQKLERDLGVHDYDPTYNVEADVSKHMDIDEPIENIFDDFEPDLSALSKSEKVEYQALSSGKVNDMARFRELGEKLYPKEVKFADKISDDFVQAKNRTYSHMRAGKVLNPFHKDVQTIARTQVLAGSNTVSKLAKSLKKVLGKGYKYIKPKIKQLFHKVYNQVERWAETNGHRGAIVRTIIGRSYAMGDDVMPNMRGSKDGSTKASSRVDENIEKKSATKSGGDVLHEEVKESLKKSEEIFTIGKSAGTFKKIITAPQRTVDEWWNPKVEKAFDKMGDALSEMADKKYALEARKDPTVKNRVKALSSTFVRNLIAVDKATKHVSEFQNNMIIETAKLSKEAKRLKESLSKLGEDENKNITQALNGDLDPDILDVNSKKLYNVLRETIDTNADELVKLGALDEKKKIDNYLKRYYQKYIDDTERGHAVTKLYHDTFKARKDLSYEGRINLGMIEDASFVVPNTILAQRKQILKAKLLKELSDKYAKDEPIEGYKMVSDETVDGSTSTGGFVKKYGALAGKYVPEDVHDALITAHIVKGSMELLEKHLYPVVDHMKVNMTVKNPTTHIFNVASNLQVAQLRGDLTAVSEVMIMVKKNPDMFKKLVDKANEFGLDSQLDDLEFDVILNKKGKADIMKSILKNIYMTQDSKMGKVARKAYDWEDKIFKLAAFYKDIKGKNLTNDEARVIFKKSTGAYVDYSTPMPVALRVLDKSGIMPFAHYTYKSTPAVMKMIVQNPIRFAMVQATMTLAGGSAWFNDDNSYSKARWAKDFEMLGVKMPNIMGVKMWGEMKLFGENDYFNFGRAAPGARLGPLSLDGGFWKTLFNVTFNHQDSLGRTLNKKDSLGTQLGFDEESYEKVAIDKMIALGESFLPTFSPFGRYGSRAIRKSLDVHNPTNDYGEELGWTEFGKRILGIRDFDQEKHIEEEMLKVQREGIKKEKPQEEIDKELDKIRAYAKKKGQRVIHKKLDAAAKKERQKLSKSKKLYTDIKKLVKVKKGSSREEIRAYISKHLKEAKEKGVQLSAKDKKNLKNYVRKYSKYYD